MDQTNPSMPVKRFSLVNYIRTAYAELRKVTWPTRENALRSTGIVVIFSVIFALFLGAVDYIFNYGLTYLISLQS